MAEEKKLNEKANALLKDDFDVYDQMQVFENGQPIETKEETAQPRDTKGRFASQEEVQREARRKAGIIDDESTESAQSAAPEVLEEQGEPEELDEEEFDDLPQGVEISRTKKGLRVEIEDPSNPEKKDVYYAKSETEALKKIAAAKISANRRIAELKQGSAPVAETPRRDAPQKLSADDEFMLLQELQTAPTKAIRKAIEAELGISLEELKDKVHQADDYTRQKKIWESASKFMAEHPDYQATPTNGSRIEAYISKMGLDSTKVEDLERAYEDLNSSGLLESSSKPTAQEQPVHTEQKPAPRKATSGLRSSGGSQAPTESKSGVLSAKEEAALDRMSVEEARDFINRKMRSGL